MNVHPVVYSVHPVVLRLIKKLNFQLAKCVMAQSCKLSEKSSVCYLADNFIIVYTIAYGHIIVFIWHKCIHFIHLFLHSLPLMEISLDIKECTVINY